MNKFKKIGLTALAGSLVATSAFAGELTATGSASIGIANTTGKADASNGKDWSMGNSVYLTGGGELDNGITVAVSYEMDQGTGNNSALGFDNHSVTLSSDTLGTLVFAGHPGTSAQGSIDATAAGDLWNNTLGLTGGPTAAASGDDSFLYTLPSMMDGLSLVLSMSPGRAGQETLTSYAATFSGIDGLSVSFGQGDSGAPGALTESTSMKASYAFGPVTLGISNNEIDHASTADVDVDSYSISYTISEDLSVSYGHETFDTAGASVDEEVQGVGVSYTSGGVTLSANQWEAKGGANVAGAKTDKWSLGASFAF